MSGKINYKTGKAVSLPPQAAASDNAKTRIFIEGEGKQNGRISVIHSKQEPVI